MGNILNIETATTNCSVSLAKNGRQLALKEENTEGYSHSEQLHLFIQQVLEDASLKFQDLDAIAVSKGPGSYTGLRIGVSAAKGLCFSLDIPLIAVPTLDSMAHQLKIDDGFIIPTLDARRMEVYSAIYDRDYHKLREEEAEIINEKSFREYVLKGKVYLIGNGAAKCGEILEHSNFRFKDAVIPSAAEMCQLSYQKFKKAAFEDIAYFEPYYLKDFLGMKQ